MYPKIGRFGVSAILKVRKCIPTSPEIAVRAHYKSLSNVKPLSRILASTSAFQNAGKSLRWPSMLWLLVYLIITTHYIFIYIIVYLIITTNYIFIYIIVCLITTTNYIYSYIQGCLQEQPPPQPVSLSSPPNSKPPIPLRMQDTWCYI
jgi:hypothetical protein